MNEEILVEQLRPKGPLVPATEDDMKAWYEMANIMKMAKEANIPVHLGMIEELPDPSVCECGELFYVSDDYMCHHCREALDA